MKKNLIPGPAVHDVPTGLAGVGDRAAGNEQELDAIDQPDWPPSKMELASLIARYLDDLPAHEYEAKVILSLLFSDANPERKVLQALLEELVAVFGGVAISVTDLIEEEEAKRRPNSERMTNLLYDIADIGWDIPDWRTLDEWLSAHAGEEVGGLVLVRSMDSALQRRWRVLPVDSIPCSSEVDHLLLERELQARLSELREELADEKDLSDLIAELDADLAEEPKA